MTKEEMLIEKDRQVETLKNMIEDLEVISKDFVDIDDDTLNNLEPSEWDEGSKIIGVLGDENSHEIIFSSECSRFFTKTHRNKK